MKNVLWCLTLAGLLGFSVHADERQTGTTPDKMGVKPPKAKWKVSVQVTGSRNVADGVSTGSGVYSLVALEDGEEQRLGGSTGKGQDSTGEVRQYSQSFLFKIQKAKNNLLVEAKVLEDISTTKDGKTTRTVSNRSRSVDGVSPGDKLTLDLGKDENSGWQYKFDIELIK